MLDHFSKKDFLSGMLVKRRDSMAGRFYGSRDIITFGTSFIPLYQISEDLTYAGPLFKDEKEKRAELDIVQVSLPSGAVLWERNEETKREISDTVNREAILQIAQEILARDDPWGDGAFSAFLGQVIDLISLDQHDDLPDTFVRVDLYDNPAPEGVLREVCVPQKVTINPDGTQDIKPLLRPALTQDEFHALPLHAVVWDAWNADFAVVLKTHPEETNIHLRGPDLAYFTEMREERELDYAGHAEFGESQYFRCSLNLLRPGQYIETEKDRSANWLTVKAEKE